MLQVPTSGLSLYEQRRLRNEDLLNRSEVRDDASVIVPPPDSSPMGRPAMSSTMRPGVTVPPRGPFAAKDAPSQPQPPPASATTASSSESTGGAAAAADEIPEGLRAVMRLLKAELKIDQDYAVELQAMGVAVKDDLALVSEVSQLTSSGFKLIHAIKILRHFHPDQQFDSPRQPPHPHTPGNTWLWTAGA